MDTFDLKVNAQKLSAIFTEFFNEKSINKIAIETGFIKRNGKLDGFKFLDLLLFTHCNSKTLSLNQLSSEAKSRYDIDISKQSIDERFNKKSVAFVKAILKKVINIAVFQDTKIDFTKYDKVRIKDATSFQLPEIMGDKYKGSGGSASKSAIKIQFEYDLKNGEILDLSFHSFTEQDTTNAKNTIDDIKPNELIIRDLGYIKIEYLIAIEEKKSFYLNRLQSNIIVYEDKKGKKIDFAKINNYLILNKLDRIEKEVYIGKEKFKTRMIIELLPRKEYEERMRKTNKEAKKKGTKISKNRKIKMRLNIFITNTDIDKKDIRPLYTLRWQIELMFKIWKSIGEIDKVKKTKIVRFETFLIIKIIWIMLNWQLMWQIKIYYLNKKNIEISPYKLFLKLKSDIIYFRRKLKQGLRKITKYIMDIIAMSPRNFKSEKKKYSKTWSYDIIKQFENQ